MSRPLSVILQEATDMYQYYSTVYFTSATTPRDCFKLFQELVSDVGRPLVRRARTTTTTSTTTSNLFWSSPTACKIYSIILLALITKRYWILHFISLLVLQKIVWILFQWMVYILVEDEAIAACLDFCRTWIQFYLREGEKILQGKDTLRYIVAGSMLQSAPSTVSYIRYYLRVKAHELNQSLAESFLERHETPYSTISDRLQARYHRAVQQGVQQLADLPSVFQPTTSTHKTT